MVCQGQYGLVALEPAWISSTQIEAARVAMTRYIKRGGKVWIKIFPDKPVTEKPAETRMGSGKGSPEYWVAVVKPGRVLFELADVDEATAREALRLADEMELDLIEISPKADPPVCRIADYQKFLYQQKKKAKELKANQTKVVVKEIRFGPQTDDHDYNFKLKHAENFLKEGAKVKAYVFFRGRSIVFKEQGEILLLRFATDLEEYAKVEMMPKLDGKKMNMMLAPKSKK